MKKIPSMNPKFRRLIKSKTTTGVLAIIVFGASVSYATLRIEAATNPPELPANKQCLKFGEEVRNALEASQHSVVAVLEETPKPTVDLAAVKAAHDDCTAHVNEYVVQQ